VAPWKLPLAVIAIAVPIALAFYAGGPGVGVAVGALAAVAIVVVAVREDPRGTIGEPAADARRRLLIVVSWPLEDPGAIDRIATLVADGEAADAAESSFSLRPRSASSIAGPRTSRRPGAAPRSGW
jgi:hypothetical protein